MVVGLGNPGPDYAGHRHNVGAMVVDELANRYGVRLRRHKSRAQMAEVRLGFRPGGAPGPRLILMRAATYMNESGGPVAALAGFSSIPPSSVIVVHDDLELPYGEVRLKLGGGEGGHNGLRAISTALRTRAYVRVRVGIGRPPGRQEAGDFVLKDFRLSERKELPFVLAVACDQVESAVTGGNPRHI